MNDATEIGEFTIGVTQLSGGKLGAKEFGMRAMGALRDLTFEIDGATFKITRAEVNSVNIPS